MKPGDVVADLGAGAGPFVVPFAKAVSPKGKVYAVDVDRNFFPYIEKRVKAAAVGNVQTVLGEFTDPKLPSSDVDVAFMHDVLHHIEDRAGYLKAVAKYPRARRAHRDHRLPRGAEPAQRSAEPDREQGTGSEVAGGRGVEASRGHHPVHGEVVPGLRQGPMTLALWLERLWHDVRYGCRTFARAPGFTAIAILSIACGTGANVAMFSVADALLLRPLPVPHPDELLVVGMRTDRGFEVTAASYPDYTDIRNRSQSFDGMLAYTLRWTGVSVGPGAAPQVKVLHLVSANFFDVLRIRPAIGRTFAAEEERVPGRDAVAVLSHGMWQQQYGGDPAILGRTIRISGVNFTIVGVTPERFTGLETRGIFETVYVPLAMAPALGDEPIRAILTARDLRLLTVRGRLKRGTGIAEARAELTAIGTDLERAYPATNADRPLIAQTELEARFADRLDAGLVLLLTILSTVVLGVACANVAGLLASRAPLRAREIALRLAMGAGRGRLIRQLITESLALAVAGGVCGLAVGRAGIVILQQMQYPNDTIQPPQWQLDERALLFSLLLATGSAFLFGLGPALQTTRVDLTGAIRVGDVGLPGRWRLTGRTTLVAIQSRSRWC